MPVSIQFLYRFHPAGQGIFASGTLSEHDSNIPFNWVFDCGSKAPIAVLQPVVERYRELILGDVLDLLCISHFDNDHVSGLTDLLKGLHVGTVVLAYYTPLERLLLGSVSDGGDADYRSFLGNPVAFLLERAASIKQIILISDNPPEGPGRDVLPDRPPQPGDAPNEGRPKGDERRWWLKAEVARASDGSELLGQDTLQMVEAAGTELLVVPGSFAAKAVEAAKGVCWEFLFFHKPISPNTLAALQRGMRLIFRREEHEDITSALSLPYYRKRIKELYKNTIQQGEGHAEDINSTSLCVYSGPELSRFHGSSMSHAWPNALVGGYSVVPPPYHGWPEECSILYTGDADFRIDANRAKVRGFLTPERWHQIAILQVPHHGSIKNWKPGVAAEFQHRFSVFCADENDRRYKHPSREVLLDLLHYGSVLANKTMGWSWRGIAYFQ